MKILEALETKCISAGTILNIGGKNIVANMDGIPPLCVDQISSMANDVTFVAESESMSAIMLVMGLHLDAMVDSGCDMYISEFEKRIKNVR